MQISYQKQKDFTKKMDLANFLTTSLNLVFHHSILTETLDETLSGTEEKAEIPDLFSRNFHSIQRVLEEMEQIDSESNDKPEGFSESEKLAKWRESTEKLLKYSNEGLKLLAEMDRKAEESRYNHQMGMLTAGACFGIGVLSPCRNTRFWKYLRRGLLALNLGVFAGDIHFHEKLRERQAFVKKETPKYENYNAKINRMFGEQNAGNKMG